MVAIRNVTAGVKGLEEKYYDQNTDNRIAGESAAGKESGGTLWFFRSAVGLCYKSFAVSSGSLFSEPVFCVQKAAGGFGKGISVIVALCVCGDQYRDTVLKNSLVICEKHDNIII